MTEFDDIVGDLEVEVEEKPVVVALQFPDISMLAYYVQSAHAVQEHGCPDGMRMIGWVNRLFLQTAVATLAHHGYANHPSVVAVSELLGPMTDGHIEQFGGD